MHLHEVTSVIQFNLVDPAPDISERLAKYMAEPDKRILITLLHQEY